MKVLISDLDGTIYRGKDVASNDLKALKDFTNSNMLVIATGRNENTFSFFTNQFDIGYAYVILCNGSLIQNNQSQTIIKHSFDQIDVAAKIFDIIDQYQDHLSITLSFEAGTLYIPRYNSTLSKHINANLNYDVIGICIEVTDRRMDIVEEIYNQLIKIAAFHVERNNQYIDILPSGVSKKNAIKELIRQLDIDENDVYVIGDSYNDLSMFEINDHSFIIESDNEDLNKQATYVVSSIAECINLIDDENIN
ncbi:MAG: HAD-IIB family hydrolase [Thomasclavelia sp.]